MSATTAALRPPTAAELDATVSRRDDLPWLALCWTEVDGATEPTVRWSLDRRDAPACARPHLLAGRRALPARTPA
jgi:hypothetical protein